METINVPALLYSLDYLRWDHPTVLNAFKVARELQKWLGNTVQEEDCPLVGVVISMACVAVTIGDICIWENESCSEDDLKFDWCREQYRQEVLRLAAAFEL